MTGLIEYDVMPLVKRGIDEETCKKWDYGVATYSGRPVQVANYRDRNGVLVAQKLRFQDKTFKWLGDPSRVGLYGCHLWRDGGKMVTIVEGEVDALSVSQSFNLKWPVVSIPNGAKSAEKVIAKNLDWLEGFDSVVLCFDQDEQGRAAAKEAAAVLSPGKVKIVTSLGFKDANGEPSDALISQKQLFDTKETHLLAAGSLGGGKPIGSFSKQRLSVCHSLIT